jgi:hypothetical protein
MGQIHGLEGVFVDVSLIVVRVVSRRERWWVSIVVGEVSEGRFVGGNELLWKSGIEILNVVARLEEVFSCLLSKGSCATKSPGRTFGGSVIRFTTFTRLPIFHFRDQIVQSG